MPRTEENATPARGERARVGLVSLGCAKNRVDSEVMLGLLREAGYGITADPAEADVIIVNTCGFIGPAKKESIDTILEMAQFKREVGDGRGHARALLVGGCLAQRYPEELAAELPEVDVFFGTNEVDKVVRLVEAALAGRGGNERREGGEKGEREETEETDRRGERDERGEQGEPVGRSPRVTVTRVPRFLYDDTMPRVLSTPAPTAYVKIAEGCDHACAFCIIPRLRGKLRSRPPDSVLREARGLAEQGVQELVLVAQDVTAYGKDLYGEPKLATLLRELDRVEGLRWIRLLYTYPTSITDELLAAVAELPKVCKYIDLPLQHADDRVLERMRRLGRGNGVAGRRADLERLVDRIRRRIPGVALRTSFIVGFPGETDEAFGRLLEFMREMEFDHAGVFAYSREEGTVAALYPDQVPAAVKRARRAEAMRLQQAISLGRRRARVGQEVPVVVERFDPPGRGRLIGRTEWQAPEVDGKVFIRVPGKETAGPGAAPGQFARVRLTGARPYDWLAELVR